MASLTPGAVEGILIEHLTVTGGHRPVLQVVRFGAHTNAQGLAREKLWLSDGDHWVHGMAVPQEGRVLMPGCFVRLVKYDLSTFGGSEPMIYVMDLEIVSPPQPRVGTLTGYPSGDRLPADAV